MVQLLFFEDFVDPGDDFLVVLAVLQLVFKDVRQLAELVLKAPNLCLSGASLLFPVHSRAQRTDLVANLVSFLLLLRADPLGY